MPKKNTNKYPSKYSNGKTVSAAQYITEIICEHMALKNKKDLHYRFWINKDWQNFYKSQIFTANKLLARYSDKAIIQALKSNKCKNTYSLRAPYLIKIIEEQQKIIDSNDTRPLQNPTSIDRNILSLGAKNKKHNSILDKLKEIDNEH